MPAFEGVLTDAEIWAVLAFIKSRWPEEIRKRQERLNDIGRR
jgi:mono/diheme cytochrome c family protein